MEPSQPTTRRPNRSNRGQATRADIIAIAKRLFSDHGYHSTGLSDIKDATGLSKGAFYHHFRSKEDLALAVLESTRCDYAERLTGPALQEAPPGQRIRAMLDGVLRLNADPQWRNCQMMATLCAELTDKNGRIHDAVRAMQLAMMELWRGLIVAAQQSGEVDRRLDATLWAQWIVQTFIGLLLARKLGTARVRPGQVIDELKRILLTPPQTVAALPADVRRKPRRTQERKKDHEND